MRFVVALSFFAIGCGVIAACQYTPVMTEVREIVAPSAETPVSAAPTVQHDNQVPSATPVTPTR
jgi:nucleoside recognition membrane protein YjiH